MVSHYSEAGLLEKEDLISEKSFWQGTRYYISDEEGRCLIQYSEDAEGLVQDSTCYTYDEEGLKKRQDRFFPQRGDVHYEEFSYVLNAAGKIIVETQRYLGNPSWVYYYEYDADGRLLHSLSTYPEEESQNRNPEYDYPAAKYENRDHLVYTYVDGLKTEMILFDWLEGYERKNTIWKYSYADERLVKEDRYQDGVLQDVIGYAYVWW